MILVRRNRKHDLLDAAVKLMAAGGPEAATVRAIARSAGVTEAGIYRHYASKDELYWQAYKRIVEAMIREKEELIADACPIQEKLRRWIELSYAYYDAQPHAFTYVLLAPPALPDAEREITTRQGRLFTQMIEQARASRQVRLVSPEMALNHFTGIMLNVPRLINQRTLEGPASRYVDEVAGAVWRVLRPEP